MTEDASTRMEFTNPNMLEVRELITLLESKLSTWTEGLVIVERGPLTIRFYFRPSEPTCPLPESPSGPASP